MPTRRWTTRRCATGLPEEQAQVQAWRYRDMLRALEFAPIISRQQQRRSGLEAVDRRAAQEASASSASRSRCSTRTPPRRDPLAFLIVKSMLLTGFDAPIEGVMYLDRPIKEAELLQTIARVNRTGHGKKFGIVVDYYGLAHHLKEALAVYAAEDVEGALQSLKDEIPVLRDRHLRVVDLFRRPRHRQPGRPRGLRAGAGRRAAARRVHGQAQAVPDSLDMVLPRPEGTALHAATQAAGADLRPARRTATATRRCWARTWAPRCAG